jgi:hypothetical protein
MTKHNWTSQLTKAEREQLKETESAIEWLEGRLAVHQLRKAKIVNRAVQRARGGHRPHRPGKEKRMVQATVS